MGEDFKFVECSTFSLPEREPVEIQGNGLNSTGQIGLNAPWKGRPNGGGRHPWMDNSHVFNYG